MWCAGIPNLFPRICLIWNDLDINDVWFVKGDWKVIYWVRLYYTISIIGHFMPRVGDLISKKLVIIESWKMCMSRIIDIFRDGKYNNLSLTSRYYIVLLKEYYEIFSSSHLNRLLS